MADTQIQQVLTAVVTQLKTITTANGYAADLAGRVYVGRLHSGDETDVPYLTLWQPWRDDGPEILNETGVNQNYSTTSRRADLVSIRHYLQGFAAPDNTDPAWPAYVLQGCVERCLGAYSKNGNPLNIPGLVRLEMSHGLVRPAGGELSPSYPYCIFNLDMILSTTRGNPYV